MFEITNRDLKMSQSRALYRLAVTPSGRELWAYMAAILEVTGMDKGAVYRLDRFLRNLRTHLENGRIVRVPCGFQLTPQGREYFRDRYSPDNRQHIERAEVAMMIIGITTGKGAGEWRQVA